MSTGTTLPSRPVYLPAKIGTNPDPVRAGGTFTASVTLSQVAQSNVVVTLTWKSLGFISPFSGPTPTSLTVPTGQITGTSTSVALIALASGSFTITAKTTDGTNTLTVNIQPAS